VPPPLAVSVALNPEQMVVGPLICTFGRAFTVTADVAVAVQLAALVTVTVYVVLVIGETVFVAPLPNPLLQAYVPPPVAVSVCDAPSQILAVVGLTAAVGLAFTVTNRDAVAVQLFALVTVTV
jgi:hypothetical protein